jgi:hypothetical protein
MAHSCPNCGQACYCGGDIDDAFDVDDSEDYCTHCDEDFDPETDDSFVEQDTGERLPNG